jgi:hypothetical protein
MPPATSIATQIDLVSFKVKIEKAFTRQRWEFKSDQQTLQAQADGDRQFQSFKQEVPSEVKNNTRDYCDSKGTPFLRSVEDSIKGVLGWPQMVTSVPSCLTL